MPACQPLSRIVQAAAIYPATVFPVGTHQSLPIPRKEQKGLCFVFLFGRGEIVGADEGYQVWPPSYAAQIAAADASFVDLRGVQPGDFGLKDDAAKPLGSAPSPQARMSDEYLTQLLKWFQAMDAVMPAFVAGQSLPPAAKEAAREARKLYEAVAEPPWKPYYAFVGADFFAWLAKAAS